MFYCSRTMKRVKEKLGVNEKADFIFDLINSFRNLNGSDEIAQFLADLLTANEIRNLSVRLRIAKLLIKGEKQRDIVLSTGSSLGTVNKVGVWLNRGGEGFRKVIAKLPLKWKMPSKLPSGPLEFHLPELVLASGQYLGVISQERSARRLIKSASSKKVIDEKLREFNKEFYSQRK